MNCIYIIVATLPRLFDHISLNIRPHLFILDVGFMPLPETFCPHQEFHHCCVSSFKVTLLHIGLKLLCC